MLTLDSATKTFRTDQKSLRDPKPPRPVPHSTSHLGMYCACVRAVTAKWDAQMLREWKQSRDAIEALPGWDADPRLKEDHARHEALIARVTPHAGRQVAAAEPVLVALLTMPNNRFCRATASVTIPEGTRYTKVKEAGYTPDPKVGVFKGVSEIDVQLELYDALRAVFDTPEPLTPAGPPVPSGTA